MGVEVFVSRVLKKGRIQYFHIHELRPHTGIPDPYLLSVPFVNSHSHLEYFGIELPSLSYFDWIVSLTQLKSEQDVSILPGQCLQAAELNFATGVGWIGEHSDRFGSAEAMETVGLGGWLFQEVLDFYLPDRPSENVAIEAARERLLQNQTAFKNASLSAHAPHTVHESTLRQLKEEGGPLSIHVNETELENQFFQFDSGRIAESRRERGFMPRRNGMRVIEYLDHLDLLDSNVQLVHACDVVPSEIELIARSGASVAHCPRSNLALGCPRAPIRELLDAGVEVGIGLDSAASSGPIDYFEEMRAAALVANERGKPLRSEEILRMATGMGYRTFGQPDGVWDVVPGAVVPLIELHLPAVKTTEELIHEGHPSCVQWVV